VLSRKSTFSADHDVIFFDELPAQSAVFLLRGDGEPYVSKTANLRRRLQRLLGPPIEHSKRLNLRDRVHEVEFTLTGSEFESQFLLYRVVREAFPKTYSARLRLRPAPLVKLHLENEYPRASVTTRLGKMPTMWGQPPPAVQSSEVRLLSNTSSASGLAHDINSSLQPEDSRGQLSPRSNLYYGPFPSRVAAEKFASDALDFFKMRRCVADLHPDPAFPGCVYSEMKMCLAPCFKGCADADYHVEVARVQAFFDTAGQSLTRELADQRERASAELAFEEAAAIHTKLDKLKPVVAQLPEIVRRIDRLRAIVVLPSGEPGSVSIFHFVESVLCGPIAFNVELRAESQSMESRVEAAIADFPAARAHSTTERMEHLAILKRWYYRSHRTGEIFFADDKGAWPLRRIVRGIGRVYRGEKAQEAASFFATPDQSASS
jgi:excinuclease UvrABC nuclease subunit